MKLQLTILLLLLFSFMSFGQNSEREKEINVIAEKQDSVSRLLFLDSTQMKNMKLVLSNNILQIWNAKRNLNAEIEQLYDIRFKFDSKEKASAFHKEYWKESSEYGPEIRKHKIKIKEITDLRVFKGSELVNGMVKAYGLQMYCYLFTVDEYFVKVYVSCKIELKPKFMKPYIEEIAKKIKQQK